MAKFVFIAHSFPFFSSEFRNEYYLRFKFQNRAKNVEEKKC